MTAPLTGHCLCGGVTFEITEPLVSASYCHCTRCQRRSGTAASANARIVPGSLHVRSGDELISTWTPEDGAPKSFCSRCGSALWSGTAAEPGGVRLGGLDGDPGIRPGHHLYVAYAPAWEPLREDGLPRYPESRPRSP